MDYRFTKNVADGCPTCGGRGYVKSTRGNRCDCWDCYGSGASGTYSEVEMSVDEALEHLLNRIEQLEEWENEK